MADGWFDRVPPGTTCGCYECQRVFASDAVEDVWDEGETPVCPYCGRDAVVVETPDMRVTPERLFAMRKTY